MAQSHVYEVIAVIAPASSDSGVITGIECARAVTLTGEGVSTRPRSRGASGDVTARVGTKPRSMRVASVSLATVGVPKKANLLIGGMGDVDEVLGVVSEKNAV